MTLSRIAVILVLVDIINRIEIPIEEDVHLGRNLPLVLRLRGTKLLQLLHDRLELSLTLDCSTEGELNGLVQRIAHRNFVFFDRGNEVRDGRLNRGAVQLA